MSAQQTAIPAEPAIETPAPAARRPRRRTDGWLWVALPGALFLLVMFGFPLIEIVRRSLTDPSPQVYRVFIDTPLYWQTLLRTFRVAALVTLTSVLLGYPFAYVMARARPALQALLIAVVLLPVWTSFLVRTFALQIWLQDSGLINKLLMRAHLIDDPVPLIRTSFGVTVGMSQILLPFMILPLYSAMRRVDPELVRAATGLGASPVRAFFRVFLPLTLSGVYAGCLLVFVLSLGFYIAPAILGGPESTMISTLIVDLVQTRSDFGTASAVAVVLLLATFAVLAVGSRFVRIRDLVSTEVER
ncbi:ABC transporter permease [Streptomyces acidiscabies]|uniref:ABC transporter permease n=1 Tax=Streptomyces acidiscabies TaxID=42234 RepID=A0AAP6EGJ9_9ACTN|nr:ABC transporter permease [Streptomyces acidiscabies]MBP5935053.1 ABC transporter permease [Streptomyces sp. LBUM 1476]MBZ3917160.1 ABC transporter permease [Streptomyces acidiscabies]MDX2961400.1 ABC transporter permease [Streptomyces acidiscabies]MDX3022758.1 ABC transporter permease [Streptomyces acidiscabies]MDX3792122.1 ABC transporter permease [Streptomyces acidiscabies]